MSLPLDRWTRLWSRLLRRRLKREVEEELAFHFDRLVEDHIDQGMDPETAWRAAAGRFGDPHVYRRAALKAEGARVRHHKRTLLMDNLRQDLRFALRQLRRRPAFCGFALTMLGLGIGANTAIFSVVYTVLLKPLPFSAPDRIVTVWESRVDRGWDRTSMAPGNFWDFRALNRTFEDLGAFEGASANLTGADQPMRLSVGRVTSGFFGTVLGVRPLLGRTLAPGEDEPGGENGVVLLSSRFWNRHFGGDRDVLGRTLTLDDEAFTVVGVLPPGRPWLDDADVFVPLVHDSEASRTSFELPVTGRLRPGVTAQATLQDLQAVARRLEEAYPVQLEGMGIVVGSSDEWVATPETRRALWVLLGAVGFLLLIACVNLANLFLARATGRVRETAIRTATGASTGRLVRQGLTESLAMSLLGAGFGLGLAVLGIRLLKALAPGQIPGLAEVTLSGWVLAFTAGTGVLTGVLTGLVPALQAAGWDPAATLRGGGRSGTENRTQYRLRGFLVSAEVALSLVLLVGAGLLLRSFGALLDTDRGFATEHRLVARVNFPDDYTWVQRSQLTDALLERLTALPDVESAAAVHIRPLANTSTGLGFTRPDDPAPEGGIPWASWRMITPRYFETMGVPLLEGRDFTQEDSEVPEGRPIPILISRRIADDLWPGAEAVGRTITLWAGQRERPGEVIGVVGNMRERGLAQDPTLAVYLPYVTERWPPDIVVHTAGEPTAVVHGFRAILTDLDANLPLSNIATMEEIVGRSVGSQRFLVVLVGLFATLALLLAVAGVYGVQSYSVAQKTAEIGVRVAIGASRIQILRTILAQAMAPAVVGVVVGLGSAAVLSRLIASLLFQVKTTDPVTYLVVAAALLTTASLAAWIPARTAADVDPVIAFRSD